MKNVIKLTTEKYYTQAELREGEERVFVTIVYCPSGQENKWMEVDDEYKTKWEEENKDEDVNSDLADN